MAVGAEQMDISVFEQLYCAALMPEVEKMLRIALQEYSSGGKLAEGAGALVDIPFNMSDNGSQSH